MKDETRTWLKDAPSTEQIRVSLIMVAPAGTRLNLWPIRQESDGNP